MTHIEKLNDCVTRLELRAHTLPPFTHVNSYTVASDGEAILIDPGFYEESSLEPVSKTLEGQTFKAIVLTHTHPDHVEGIELVRQSYPNAPICVHANEVDRVEEYVNVQILDIAQSFFVGGLELRPIFTPGHSPGHVSFYLPKSRLAIVGDMVAGFGSIWIGTPEGNVNDYFKSLEALGKLELEMLAPGHGDVMTEPYKKLAEVKEHRLQRLEQVRVALKNRPLTLGELQQVIYPDIDPRITTLAERSLLALLEKLEQDRIIEPQDKTFRLVNNT
jgi:glyoxylase-like metal-dependent hydrolase (beta-lactamase superfamily II)